MVAEKKWKDAKEFYTKGIMALKQAPKSKPGTGNSVASDTEEEREAEKGKEKTIEEACYVNRALCNLELSTSFPLILLPPSQQTPLTNNTNPRKPPLHPPRHSPNPPPRPAQPKSPLPLLPRPPRSPQIQPRPRHRRPRPIPHLPILQHNLKPIKRTSRLPHP